MEEMKEGRQERGSRRLTRQISSECVHCVGFLWPKTTILGKFWELMYRPPFTDEGQIWCAIADPHCTFRSRVKIRLDILSPSDA